MQALIKTPETASRFRLLLPLMVSLLFSLSLIIFRVWYSGGIYYTFLVWNLFLAFIPLAISTMLVLHEENIKSIFSLFIIVSLWLVFFPNAPYIITDLFHLQARNNIPLWYDLAMILSFAWNGLMLGFVSLADVQKVLAKRFGSFLGWAFAILAIVLGSFGIYLGRYLRWNSWDIITNPISIAYDITERVLNPLVYPKAWAMTIVFSTFLLLCYLQVGTWYLKRSTQ